MASFELSQPLPAMGIEAASTHQLSQKPGTVDPGHPLTVWQAYVHTFKGNTGVGILGFPLHFARAGIKPSIVIYLLVAAQGIYGMMLTVSVQQHAMRMSGRTAESDQPRTHYLMRSDRLSLEDVAEIILGKWGRILVQCTVTAFQFGVAIVFMSFVKVNLEEEFCGSSHLFLLSIVLVICICLSLLPDLSRLAPVSFVGSIGMIVVIVGCIGLSFWTNLQPPTAAPQSFVGLHPWWALLASSFYSLEGVALVLPVGNAMERASASRYPTILGQTMLLVVVQNLLLGSLAGMAFPEVDNASFTAFLLRRLPGNSLVAFVDWLASVAVLLSFPLQLVPGVQVIEAALQLESKPAKTVARVIPCVICAVLGRLLPNNRIVDLIGALAGAPLAALPYLMHACVLLKSDPKDRSLTHLMLDIAVCVFCCIVLFLGIGSALGPHQTTIASNCIPVAR